MSRDLKKNTYGLTRIPGPPELTIRDVDQAIVQLFEQKMDIQTIVVDEKTGGSTNRRVPVMFSGGERFAQNSQIGRYGEARDRTGKIMKPCISIVRGDINQNPAEYKGIAVSYPHRKLTHRIITPTGDRKLKTPNTRGIIIGKNSNDVLAPPTEYIVYDRPEYMMISYKVYFWAAFQSQMNEMVVLAAQARDMSNMYNLVLDSGHRLSCFIDGNVANQSNSENFMDEGRMFMSQFTLNVAAPIRSSTAKTSDVLVRQSPRSFNFEIVSKSRITRIDEENYLQYLEGNLGHINPYQIVDESTLSVEDMNPYRRPRRTIESTLVSPLFSTGRVMDLMIMRPTIATQREQEFGSYMGSKVKREKSYIADSQEVHNRIFNGRYVVGGKVIS